MAQFVKFTSAYNDATMNFNLEKITLIIDNEQENKTDNKGALTLILVEGSPEAFAVKESFKHVTEAVRS